MVGPSAWVIPSERDPRSEAERVGSRVMQGALLAQSPSHPPAPRPGLSERLSKLSA